MGMRTKSKPQSCIHLKCGSSVLGKNESEGLGEKKSSRLNPLHFGNLFFTGGMNISGSTDAWSVLPDTIKPACLTNDLLFITSSFYSDKKIHKMCYTLMPPLTSIRCPLTQAASDVQRNATTGPISLACP